MPLCGPVSNKKDTEFLQYINSVFFCVSVFFFVSLQLLNCINQKTKDNGRFQKIRYPALGNEQSGAGRCNQVPVGLLESLYLGRTATQCNTA